MIKVHGPASHSVHIRQALALASSLRCRTSTPESGRRATHDTATVAAGRWPGSAPHSTNRKLTSVNLESNNEKVRRHAFRGTAMVLAQGSARSRTAPGFFEPKLYIWRGTTNPAALPILRDVVETTRRNRAAGVAKARAAKAAKRAKAAS